MQAIAATPENNISLMRTAFAALNRGDLDACVGLLTPDFIINLAGMPYPKRGHSAWRANAEMLHSAFSDARIHIEDMFATGDKVAVRARFTGRHTGEFLGMQPTGKPVEYLSNELYRIKDGKIAEEWICVDSLTMMMQIGAIPARHLVSMWLAGYRTWLAACLGALAGA
ncbi:ester cyclase, partial [Rhizobiaceae sp. 2RAB30]